MHVKRWVWMVNVLFVCSANKDRSPTAERVFRDVDGWKVRSAGTMPDARNSITSNLLDWANRIFVMETHHKKSILETCPSCLEKITVLGIKDEYNQNSAKLISQLIFNMANFVDLDNWIIKKF